MAGNKDAKTKAPKRGSNLLCRVANPTPEKVCEYVRRMPKHIIPEQEFRTYMGDEWFQNIHQAPEQWGLYYIDGKNFYPRFNRDITLEEAKTYLYGWLKRLIVINPYTNFRAINDKGLVLSIVEQLESNPAITDLKAIMTNIIGNGESFIINDILVNTLNTYSEVLKIEIKDKEKEKFKVALLDNYKETIKEKYTMTKKEYFDLFDGIVIDFNQTLPLQQIFYGAPGTGKSNTIKRQTDVAEKDGRVIRTTFHPDSDYSTFVGCYKPKMKEIQITKDGVTTKEEKIVYAFCPQAFTNAYVKAWNTKEDVYLIIEEINRGNCAQIFGDLFQLLDRKNGESEYPIDADSDLANYIGTALRDSTRTDIPPKVQDGSKLMLPANLYIWATMNTSDQSLFPIDSAFKRRWDWKYIPIKKHDEGYIIKIDDETTYDWWGFLEKINQVIDDTTSSEDKKLGYFFVKAEDKIIGADKFVGKVLFYLWNDVFKNYGFDNPIFSKGENKKFTFSDFFQQDGTPNVAMVKNFLKKLDETIDKDKPFEKKPDESVAPSA